MIPKIIHYCWLSNEPFPAKIEACLSSWREHLPDYEFMLWDTNRFDINKELWTKQAFETKKYAFASDYIRLYALYHYGGIYLDCDVEVLKCFNDLLHRQYFIGMEEAKCIEAAVIGSEKGAKWIKDCLSYYKKRPFIKSDGSLDIEIIPYILEKGISKTRTIKELSKQEILKLDSLIKDNKTFYVYPYQYFSSKNRDTYNIEDTQDSYSIHHFTNMWIPKRLRIVASFRRSIVRLIGLENTIRFGRLLGLSKVRKGLVSALNATLPKHKN